MAPWRLRATPPDIAAKLTGTLIEALRSADVRDKLEPQGAELIGNTPEEFATFVKAEIAKWGGVVRAAGVRAN